MSCWARNRFEVPSFRTFTKRTILTMPWFLTKAYNQCPHWRYSIWLCMLEIRHREKYAGSITRTSRDRRDTNIGGTMERQVYDGSRHWMRLKVTEKPEEETRVKLHWSLLILGMIKVAIIHFRDNQISPHFTLLSPLDRVAVGMCFVFHLDNWNIVDWAVKPHHGQNHPGIAPEWQTDWCYIDNWAWVWPDLAPNFSRQHWQ